MTDCIKSISTFHRMSQQSLLAELYDLRIEITVWGGKKHHPSHTTAAKPPDFHFLFFCRFLLSHSISLGLDHRYFTALSLISSDVSFIPTFPFPAQIVISALFDFLCCFVQSRSSTPPVACQEILVALLV